MRRVGWMERFLAGFLALALGLTQVPPAGASAEPSRSTLRNLQPVQQEGKNAGLEELSRALSSKNAVGLEEGVGREKGNGYWLDRYTQNGQKRVRVTMGSSPFGEDLLQELQQLFGQGYRISVVIPYAMGMESVNRILGFLPIEQEGPGTLTFLWSQQDKDGKVGLEVVSEEMDGQIIPFSNDREIVGSFTSKSPQDLAREAVGIPGEAFEGYLQEYADRLTDEQIARQWELSNQLAGELFAAYQASPNLDAFLAGLDLQQIQDMLGLAPQPEAALDRLKTFISNQPRGIVLGTTNQAALIQAIFNTFFNQNPPAIPSDEIQRPSAQPRAAYRVLRGSSLKRIGGLLAAATVLLGVTWLASPHKEVKEGAPSQPAPSSTVENKTQPVKPQEQAKPSAEPKVTPPPPVQKTSPALPPAVPSRGDAKPAPQKATDTAGAPKGIGTVSIPSFGLKKQQAGPPSPAFAGGYSLNSMNEWVADIANGEDGIGLRNYPQFYGEGRFTVDTDQNKGFGYFRDRGPYGPRTRVEVEFAAQNQVVIGGNGNFWLIPANQTAQLTLDSQKKTPVNVSGPGVVHLRHLLNGIAGLERFLKSHGDLDGKLDDGTHLSVKKGNTLYVGGWQYDDRGGENELWVVVTAGSLTVEKDGGAYHLKPGNPLRLIVNEDGKGKSKVAADQLFDSATPVTASGKPGPQVAEAPTLAGEDALFSLLGPAGQYESGRVYHQDASKANAYLNLPAFKAILPPNAEIPDLSSKGDVAMGGVFRTSQAELTVVGSGATTITVGKKSFEVDPQTKGIIHWDSATGKAKVLETEGVRLITQLAAGQVAPGQAKGPGGGAGSPPPPPPPAVGVATLVGALMPPVVTPPAAASTAAAVAQIAPPLAKMTNPPAVEQTTPAISVPEGFWVVDSILDLERDLKYVMEKVVGSPGPDVGKISNHKMSEKTKTRIAIGGTVDRHTSFNETRLTLIPLDGPILVTETERGLFDKKEKEVAVHELKPGDRLEITTNAAFQGVFIVAPGYKFLSTKLLTEAGSPPPPPPTAPKGPSSSSPGVKKAAPPSVTQQFLQNESTRAEHVVTLLESIAQRETRLQANIGTSKRQQQQALLTASGHREIVKAEKNVRDVFARVAGGKEDPSHLRPELQAAFDQLMRAYQKNARAQSSLLRDWFAKDTRLGNAVAQEEKEILQTTLAKSILFVNHLEKVGQWYKVMGRLGSYLPAPESLLLGGYLRGLPQNLNPEQIHLVKEDLQLAKQIIWDLLQIEIRRLWEDIKLIVLKEKRGQELFGGNRSGTRAISRIEREAIQYSYQTIPFLEAQQDVLRAEQRLVMARPTDISSIVLAVGMMGEPSPDVGTFAGSSSHLWNQIVAAQKNLDRTLIGYQRPDGQWVPGSIGKMVEAAQALQRYRASVQTSVKSSGNAVSRGEGVRTVSDNARAQNLRRGLEIVEEQLRHANQVGLPVPPLEPLLQKLGLNSQDLTPPLLSGRGGLSANAPSNVARSLLGYERALGYLPVLPPEAGLLDPRALSVQRLVQPVLVGLDAAPENVEMHQNKMVELENAQLRNQIERLAEIEIPEWNYRLQEAGRLEKGKAVGDWEVQDTKDNLKIQIKRAQERIKQLEAEIQINEADLILADKEISDAERQDAVKKRESAVKQYETAVQTRLKLQEQQAEVRVSRLQGRLPAMSGFTSAEEREAARTELGTLPQDLRNLQQQRMENDRIVKAGGRLVDPEDRSPAAIPTTDLLEREKQTVSGPSGYAVLPSEGRRLVRISAGAQLQQVVDPVYDKGDRFGIHMTRIPQDRPFAGREIPKDQLIQVFGRTKDGFGYKYVYRTWPWLHRIGETGDLTVVEEYAYSPVPQSPWAYADRLDKEGDPMNMPYYYVWQVKNVNGVLRETLAGVMISQMTMKEALKVPDYLHNGQMPPLKPQGMTAAGDPILGEIYLIGQTIPYRALQYDGMTVHELKVLLEQKIVDRDSLRTEDVIRLGSNKDFGFYERMEPPAGQPPATRGGLEEFIQQPQMQEVLGSGRYVIGGAVAQDSQGQMIGSVPDTAIQDLIGREADGWIAYRKGVAFAPEGHRVDGRTHLFISEAFAGMEVQERVRADFVRMGVPGDNVQFVPADASQAPEWVRQAAELQAGGKQVVMLLDATSYGEAVKQLLELGPYAQVRPMVALVEGNRMEGLGSGNFFILMTHFLLRDHIIRFKAEVLGGLEERTDAAISYSIEA